MEAQLEEQSTPGLVSLIYKGDIQGLTDFLNTFPPEKSIIFAHEPYCNIQGKRKAKCLKMLCDDPRFRFDHLFVARMFYFSTREVHSIIGHHPRLKQLIKDKQSFMDFFWENYPGGQNAYMGISQRYIQARNVLSYLKKKQNIRLVFFLYPFLTQVSRMFREKYYQPGGKGYFKAMARYQLSSCE